MAADELEVVISQLVDEIGRRFQRLNVCFPGPAIQPNYCDTVLFKCVYLLRLPVGIFLYRKVHIFLRASLTDICRIPHRDDVRNWTERERVDQGWWFSRVEFTETRGIQHWHILAKLAEVLDTAVFGRMIHNGRLV